MQSGNPNPNPVSPTYSMSSTSASASKLSFSKAGKGVLAASKLTSLGASTGGLGSNKTIAPPRPPALVAAIERDNMTDLLKKNDDYFNRVINSQVSL